MRVYTNFMPIKMLRIALGAFFLILGFYGIMRNIDEGMFTLNQDGTLEVIFGVIEIICGILLLMGLFLFKTRNAVYWAGLSVLIFWVARIVLSLFIWGLRFNNSGIQFLINGRPDFHMWLLTLVTDLVIGSAIFVIVKRYD